MPWPPPMHSVTSRAYAVALHRVQQPRGSTAPLAPIGWPCAMAPPSTFTTSGQAEFMDHSQHDRGEGFIDLEPVHVADSPAGALQRLAHGRHWSKAENPGSTAPIP